MQNTFYFWFQKTKKFLHMHNNNVYLSSQTIWIESAFNLLSRLQFELHRNHQTSKGEHSEPNFAEIQSLKDTTNYSGLKLMWFVLSKNKLLWLNISTLSEEYLKLYDCSLIDEIFTNCSLQNRNFVIAWLGSH